MPRNLALWAGILVGPIVWLISFEANYALAPWACIKQGKLSLYVISIIALLISAGSGLLAWREWKELAREFLAEGGGALARSRVMALAGMLMSAMFCLVIVAQAVPELVLAACE